MSELFNNLRSAILEAIDCAKGGYTESPSDCRDEDLECHECDGMTVCPNKPSDESEEESEDDLEQNMLLRDLGRGGE